MIAIFMGDFGSDLLSRLVYKVAFELILLSVIYINLYRLLSSIVYLINIAYNNLLRYLL